MGEPGVRGVGGIAAVVFVLAGHTEIGGTVGAATLLLVAARDLLRWVRNRRIVLHTIPKPLAQELRACLESGDRQSVLARLREEYPQLPLGKTIELMATL